MKFSLRLNNDLTVPEYVALAQAAEAAGFDQFWVSNDLFLRSVPVILTAVAQATERIEIGTCVVNPYTMHPAEIAMLAATLDELSGGRFNLGIAPVARNCSNGSTSRTNARLRRRATPSRRFARSLTARQPKVGRRKRTCASPSRGACRSISARWGRRCSGSRARSRTACCRSSSRRSISPPCSRSSQRARQPPVAPLDEIDLAACIWVSLSDDRARRRGRAARQNRLLRRRAQPARFSAGLASRRTISPRSSARS